MPKGIRFFHAVARNPDRDLGEARSAIDRGNGQAALRSLDRARRGYLRDRDADGLAHVLDMAALVDSSDDRARIANENLAYAVEQNIRQESRRAARERKEPWVDPYPNLQAPTEHTRLPITRPIKIAIGVGVVLGIAAIAGIVAAAVLVDNGPQHPVTLRFVNDTPRSVHLLGCDNADCITTFMDREVKPGLETETRVNRDDLVDLFRIQLSGPDECLPVRVHDAYLRFGGDGQVLAVPLSQATPCPGTTVLPRPAQPTPL